jgi:hypothetical protein
MTKSAFRMTSLPVLPRPAVPDLGSGEPRSQHQPVPDLHPNRQLYI